jgi:hypothetical protein
VASASDLGRPNRQRNGNALGGENLLGKRLLRRLLAELIAELRAEITAEISEAVGRLRTEVNVQRGIDKGTVTELPNPLARRDAARA